MIVPEIARKAGYGALFTIVLPVFLVVWTARTSMLMPMPVMHDVVGGSIGAVAGFVLIVWGMASLWFEGGGLPMNAYPPPRLVTSGIYGIFPHPIYIGFVLLCFGLSVLTGSTSAFWLVSPAVALASIALVFGYERPDLERRFGAPARAGYPWLPVAGSTALDWYDLGLFYAVVIVPWLLIFEFIEALGVQPAAIDLRLPVERSIPLLEWTKWLYVTTYFVVLAFPPCLPSRDQLRKLCVRVWTAMVLVFPLYLLLPSTPAEAFPSFHAIWSVLIAESCVAAWPGFRSWFRAWAAAAIIASVTTGIHSTADVLAGVAVALLAIHAQLVWAHIQRQSERIANSWREWTFGRVRLINHGVYAGIGTFIAYSIIGAIVGPRSEGVVAFTAIAALLGAGAWAQWIEGSPRLLRPYGFYGGIAGVIVASILAGPLFGVSAWLLMGAHCIAAPWLQSFGRLRCLVQGCCHGAPAAAHIGIRYHHPRSRVTRLAGLADVPVHPTQLYSIFWNIPIALVMIRLWILGAPLHLISGIYLLLTGIGRFVEEAYRGEPQTPIFRGLRVYQWIAVGTVIAGAVITASFRSAAAPSPQLTWESVANAAILGVAATAALGVDFPESTRRFARLT